MDIDVHVTQEHGVDRQDRRLKRRQVSRDPEQKHACNFEGCDKKYSRREHLVRHKLNRMEIH